MVRQLGCLVAIAIGAEGLPVLSYLNSQALWVTKCGTVSC
jgi:hypothetical protein